jgi:hypothetical protein
MIRRLAFMALWLLPISATPSAMWTLYLSDLVPGHSYTSGSIDGRAPDISSSGDTWHLTGGTVDISGYEALEKSPGASAIINLGDANSKHYAATVWMPIIAYQAEGGILVRASSNACAVPNTGDYFYIGYHGSSFGIYDSDPRPPDPDPPYNHEGYRHYLSSVAAGILIADMPAQAQPISDGYGMGWHANIEVYDNGSAMIVLVNGVNIFGTVSIPWYSDSSHTYFGISGGDYNNVIDAAYSIQVEASNGLTPLPMVSPTSSPTFTATPTVTVTLTRTMTPTATPTVTATPASIIQMIYDNRPRKMRRP